MRPNLCHELFEIRRFGRGANRVVFVHGLFSSSGIWVNSFNLFQRSHFVLVDIDYSHVVRVGAFERLLKELPEAVGPADLVVSHSFGSVVHLLLGRFSQENVWIGPSFLATEFRENAYLNFLRNRIEDGERIASASTVVEFAVRESRKAAEVGGIVGEVLFPERDEFFSYPNSRLDWRFFDGAHGDVSLGLSALRNSLNDRQIAAFFGPEHRNPALDR